MSATLAQAERTVNDLTPADQARLLRYLAPKVAGLVLQRPPDANRLPEPPPADTGDKAWEHFLAIGQDVTAAAPPTVTADEVLA